MDAIEQVTSRLDIVTVISSYIQLKKAGRNFKANCPFHSEKTPSLVVSPELQIYKCFGCGAGGNAIKFVSEFEKITFGEALRLLADKARVKLDSFKPDKTQLEKERLYAVNHLASEFYHYILTSHKAGEPARQYLAHRGVTKDNIKSYKIGFAPQSWENLKSYLVKKKGYSVDDLVKAGLAVRSTGVYDRFRNRVIFPLFDHRGNVVGFSGRVLNETEKEAKYINTPETLLYHKSDHVFGLFQAKEAIKQEGLVVLAEGELDVIASTRVGIKNIVAVKGSAITVNQIKLLNRFCPIIYFCLDTDSAGLKAAERGIDIALSGGMLVKAISVPVGKDIDECVRIDPGLWKKAVKKPILIWDFYLDNALKIWPEINAEAKKTVSEKVLPLFVRIDNEVVKAHYFKKLAQVLDVSEEVILRQVQKINKRSDINSYSKPYKEEEKEARPRKETLDEYILASILQSKKDLEKLLKTEKSEFLTSPVVKRIFEYLLKWPKSTPFDIAKFVTIVPDELKDTVNRLFLATIPELKEEKDTEKDWLKTWNEVEKMYWHDKLSELRKDMNNEEDQEVQAKVLKIVHKLKSL